MGLFGRSGAQGSPFFGSAGAFPTTALRADAPQGADAAAFFNSLLYDDVVGPVSLSSWRFRLDPEDGSGTTIGDIDGGQNIIVTGVFPGNELLEAWLQSDSGAVFPLWRGDARRGEPFFPQATTTLVLALPALPPSTPMKLWVRHVPTGSLAWLEFGTTSHRAFRTKSVEFRKTASPDLDVGPRSVASEVVPANTRPEVLGPAAALYDAIGSVANDAAGGLFTLLQAAASAGATTVVAPVAGHWPAAGSFLAEGVRYFYAAKTPTGLSGITHLDDVGATVSGLKAALEVRTPIFLEGEKLTGAAGDVHLRTFSALDRMRLELDLDFAEGSRLDAIGAARGLLRPQGIDDATFRKLVRAVGLARRGTRKALEGALTAVYGAGNWQIRRRPGKDPSKLFIGLKASATLSATPAGRTILTGRDPVLINATTRIGTTPSARTRIVRVLPANFVHPGQQWGTDRPSSSLSKVRFLDGYSDTELWVYAGTLTEATVVNMLNPGCRFADAAGGSMLYRYPGWLPDKTTDAFMELSYSTTGAHSATLAQQPFVFGVSFVSNAVAASLATDVRVSVAHGSVQLMTAAGALVGSAVTTLTSGRNTIRVQRVSGKKPLSLADEDLVVLTVNGIVTQKVSASLFPATTGSNALLNFAGFYWGRNSTAAVSTEITVFETQVGSEARRDLWRSEGVAALWDKDTFNGDACAFLDFTGTGITLSPSDIGKTVTSAGTKDGTRGTWAIQGVVGTKAFLASPPAAERFTMTTTTGPNGGKLVIHERPFFSGREHHKAIFIMEGGKTGLLQVVDERTGGTLQDLDDFSHVAEIDSAGAVPAGFNIPGTMWPTTDQTEASVPVALNESGSLSGMTLTLRPLDGVNAAYSTFGTFSGDIPTIVEYEQELGSSGMPSVAVIDSPEGTYAPAYLGDGDVGVLRSLMAEILKAGADYEVFYF